LRWWGDSCGQSGRPGYVLVEGLLAALIAAVRMSERKVYRKTKTKESDGKWDGSRIVERERGE